MAEPPTAIVGPVHPAGAEVDIGAGAGAGNGPEEEDPGAGAVAGAPPPRQPRQTVARPVAITKNGPRQFILSQRKIRIFLQNCVATVDLAINPDLAKIATHARNAEYNPRRFAAAIVRLRDPKATALIFHSGKMVVTGAKHEDAARLAARKFAKILTKLGFKPRFKDFKVQNIVGTASLNFPIRLEGLADEHGRSSSYEPELFPGLVFRMANPKVVFLVFVSGKVVMTGAKTRTTLLAAFEKMYPTLAKYKKQSRAT